MNKIRRLITGLVTAVFLTCVAVPCYGAPQNNWNTPDVLSLRPGVEYTNFDVTGDGISDHLLVSYGEQEGFLMCERNHLQICINGITALSMDDPYYRGDVTARYDVKLCTISQGDVFFFIRTISKGEYCNFCRLYQYKNGKLELALDLKEVYKDACHYREYVDVAGTGKKEIFFQWYSQLGAVGGLNWIVSYVYNGNGFRQSDRICPVAPEELAKFWTASREFAVYDTCSLKVEEFRVKEGERVKITDVYQQNGRFFLRIKTIGREGWIPCPNEQSSYFEEALYI